MTPRARTPGCQYSRIRLCSTYPIETRRLQLRPLTVGDTDALVAYRSPEDVCRFVPFTPMDQDVITERLNGVWSRKDITAEGHSLTLGVERSGSGELIGDVVLFFRSVEHRGGEVGWVFHPDRGGLGYGTEAAHALLHLAFDGLGLHRVIARIDSRNDSSVRLAERLGMRREAHLIANEWFNGAWSDEIDLALLENEWAAQHAGGADSCRWPLSCPR